ncbi:adenylate/guanylate cyclase domain-containing protein [Marinobacterium sedimentorum]|uniref:adenylate/guanylate cyclase domain-containing protein n=1 Tax=Marinobacterium sedimentorum TaxID=2927804 RepID=UPI0020C5CE0D|nr:adenylate/guanylate cyclase domain-containing protein [Marinobacterium sedimentorum]MCP8688440.1 adenylate/guanylate cyclase domain-containing protein [Marinobacterium sedimentorum]
MSPSQGQRKLTAILSADVVGYSHLMGEDEQATVDTLKQYQQAIGRVIERHMGRIVDAPGDNILAEFPSAVEAVNGAVEIQKVLEGRNLELPSERRMEFRIGVNLGDVIEDDSGIIFGDGVNIAARMEALAEPGGICISSPVYDAVEGKVHFGYDFLGEQRVKNIAMPVSVYRVRAGSDMPLPARWGITRALWDGHPWVDPINIQYRKDADHASHRCGKECRGGVAGWQLPAPPARADPYLPDR